MACNTDKLIEDGLLACPSCTNEITSSDLVCNTCDLQFPLLGDIPILVDNPETFLGDWFEHFRNYILKQQAIIQQENYIVDSGTHYAPQKSRLQNIVNARIENLSTLADIMRPLRDYGPGKKSDNLIKSSGQFNHIVYFLRDWGWHNNEPEVMCNKITEILPDDLSVKSLLVLGAGACKESYLLHNHYNSPLTVSLEIDPLKLLGAASIISGNTLYLNQILINNVRNASDNVSRWELKCPSQPDNDFTYILANATRLPFTENAFHVLVTPFLIDAVGEDLRTLAPKIHKITQPDGYWVNYGVMAFQPEMSYTGEEVIDIVETSGFEILEYGYQKKSHLSPEESCQQQIYDCLYFAARKK